MGVHKKGRDMVDKLFLKFIKHTLSIKQSTSTDMVLGESGQFLPSNDCIFNVVSFLNRLLHMNENYLVKKVYNELQKLHDCGFNTWCSKAWELVHQYNLNIDLDKLNFKLQCKQSIRNCFIRDWLQRINDINISPIMRTYRLFKSDFYLEPYLIKVSNFKYRNAITKLRTSSHELNIEKGRHSPNHVPVEKRLCEICNTIEDESHFLLSCELYKNERLVLYKRLDLNRIDDNLQSTELLYYLLGSNDQHHLELIGQFIYVCFQKRKDYYSKTPRVLM